MAHTHPQFDRSSGQVYLFSGKTFFSPNSTRHVSLPPARDPIRNIFLAPAELPVQAPSNSQPLAATHQATKASPAASAIAGNLLNPIDSAPGIARRLITPTVARKYDFSRVNLYMYLEPQWWTQLWGWMAFVPLSPILHDPDGAFECLRRRPSFFYKADGSCRLQEHIVQSVWLLENNIIFAVHQLGVLTQTSVVFPPPPKVFGYQQWHRSAHAAFVAWRKSAEWFNIWIGLMSYLIAVAESKEESMSPYPDLCIHNWMKHLVDQGFRQTWIDALRSSVVCSFQTTCPRAGVFVHVQPGNSNQPWVGWYCRYGVPVWYPWNDDVPAICDPYLASIYGPIPEGGLVSQVASDELRHMPDTGPIVQDETDSRAHRPTRSHPGSPRVISWGNQPMALSPLQLPDSDIVAEAGKLQDPDIVWKEFFANRAMRNESIIRSENDIERQRRLNRERTPATKSAKIFEWELDENGIYQRRSVLGKFKLDTLEGYSHRQRRYDPIRNEYDCCEAFGGDDDEDSASSCADISMQGDDVLLSQEAHSAIDKSACESASLTNCSTMQSGKAMEVSNNLQTVHAEERLQVAPSDTCAEETSAEGDLESQPITETEASVEVILSEGHPMRTDYVPQNYKSDEDWIPENAQSDGDQENATFEERLEAEILRVAYLRFGYSPMSTQASNTAVLDERQQKALLLMIGMTWDLTRLAACARPLLASVHAFFSSLISSSPISHMDWDLGASHIRSLVLCARFSAIRELKGRASTLYMFDLPCTRSPRWKLTVTSPVDALMACRLDANMSISDIARYFLQHGIPFKTLLPSSVAKRAANEFQPLAKPPLRPPGYLFTCNDYDAYRDRCLQIFSTPRGRAAILMGGNLWRLAVPHVCFDSVLKGPTGWYTQPEKMYTITISSTGVDYIDDQLTSDEVDLLCGLSYYSTGYGQQVAKVTWYPRPATFAHSGHDYGHWTEASEKNFTSCYEKASPSATDQISSGQPMSVTKWRDVVRGSGNLRRMNLMYHKRAEEYLSRHLTPQQKLSAM